MVDERAVPATIRACQIVYVSTDMKYAICSLRIDYTACTILHSSKQVVRVIRERTRPQRLIKKINGVDNKQRGVPDTENFVYDLRGRKYRAQAVSLILIISVKSSSRTDGRMHELLHIFYAY